MMLFLRGEKIQDNGLCRSNYKVKQFADTVIL